LQTRFFGEVEYSDEAVIRLAGGIPPFVEQTRFLLLTDAERQPLIFVQSVDEAGLCFIAMAADQACAGYEINLNAEQMEALGWRNGETQAALTQLAILTVPECGPVTANLLAPLVIDLERRVGIQSVRTDGRYSHAAPLGGTAREEAECLS